MAKMPHNFKLNDLYRRFNLASRDLLITEVYSVSDPWGPRQKLMSAETLELAGWLRDGCGQICSLWNSTEMKSTILIDEFQHGAHAIISICTASFEELAELLIVLDGGDMYDLRTGTDVGCSRWDDLEH